MWGFKCFKERHVGPCGFYFQNKPKNTSQKARFLLHIGGLWFCPWSSHQTWGQAVPRIPQHCLHDSTCCRPLNSQCWHSSAGNRWGADGSAAENVLRWLCVTHVYLYTHTQTQTHTDKLICWSKAVTVTLVLIVTETFDAVVCNCVRHGAHSWMVFRLCASLLSLIDISSGSSPWGLLYSQKAC